MHNFGKPLTLKKCRGHVWKMKAIADATNGPEILRILLVDLDLSTNCLHIDIHPPRLNVAQSGTYHPQKMMSPKSLSWIPDKIFEEAELAGCCSHWLTLDGQGHSIRIQFNFAKLEQLGLSES
jgi:hypothetical protein